MDIDKFNKTIEQPNFDNDISKVEFNLRDMFTPCRYYELTKLLPGQIFISNINECLKARN